MPDYTFHTLSDADFEDLASDLLSASLNRRFQRFTAGRDGGVDLLHGARICEGTVVQCKHFWRSGFAKLRADIANKELPKIAGLAPKQYILVTSVGLTPNNKADLLALLRPHCRGLDDIYGRNDINTLLRAHPNVETAHFKLWLTSVPVLQRILRHGMAVWNALTQSEIERKMSLYVQTRAYAAALDILRTHNYCIISGIPGVGKTTLAQVLVTRLMEAGFELVAVREDVGEALDVLDTTKRQVVYYDDFLGRSSIGERLNKNEDRGILRLLGEASRSKLLKVVFTTREYILNDAKRLYEPLAGPELEVAKCIVRIEDYTRANRARILYNHLYFSNLPHEYVAALSRNRAYKPIVDHRNYNPRLIEWMTSTTGVQGIQSSRFVDEFVNTLNDPLQIWRHAFDHQIGTDAQLLLLSLASVAGVIMALDDLQAAWAAALSPGTPVPITRELRNRFGTALKQLDGSFIRTERGHSEIGVSFHNPSIRDYVARRIATDANLRRELLTTSQFFEQVSYLVRLGSNGRTGDTPSAIVGEDALREAVRRTFGARSPLLHRVVQGRGESTFLKASPEDPGARLSDVAAWAETFGGPWLEFVCGFAARADTLGTRWYVRDAQGLPISGECHPSVAARRGKVVLSSGTVRCYYRNLR